MIHLTPKTKKGKDRIARDGADWAIHTIQPRVFFDERPGPWARIHPIEHDHRHAASRWVHLTDDVDFEVSMIELDSVGTALCPDTLLTFPIDADGFAMLDNPVHLDDTCDEWRSCLNVEDAQVLANLRYSKNFRQPVKKLLDM